MGPAEPERTWDVLIVSPPGRVGDVALDLHAAIAVLGLRVKLDLLPHERALPLPEACASDARRSRLSVVLSGMGAATLYAILPAPQFQGQTPSYAPVGKRGGPREVEMGELTEGVESLAARVAERLR